MCCLFLGLFNDIFLCSLVRALQNVRVIVSHYVMMQEATTTSALSQELSNAVTNLKEDNRSPA